MTFTKLKKFSKRLIQFLECLRGCLTRNCILRFTFLLVALHYKDDAWSGKKIPGRAFFIFGTRHSILLSWIKVSIKLFVYL